MALDFKSFGVGFEFVAGNSLRAMKGVGDGLKGVTDAAQNFVSVGADLTLMGRGISETARAMLAPIKNLAGTMLKVGEDTEFSILRLQQFQNVLGTTGVQTFTRMRSAALDTALSFRETGQIVEQLASTGIDALKSYGEGVVQRGGKTLTYQKNLNQSITDLATARGVDSAIILGNVQQAIMNNNIHFLEHWIGKQKTFQLQMMGGLQGTIQQKTEQITKFIDGAFGGMGRKAAETFKGISIEIRDILGEDIPRAILDVTSPEGPYQRMLTFFIEGFDIIKLAFIGKTGISGSIEAADASMKAFAKAFHLIFNPVVDVVGNMIVKLAKMTSAFVDFAKAHPKFLAFFMGGFGIIGLLLTAGGAFVTFGAVILAATKALFGFLGAFGTMGIVMGGAFLTVVLALTAFKIAWVNNWLDIQGSVQSAVGWIEEAWDTTVAFFGALGDILRTAAGETFIVSEKHWAKLPNYAKSFLLAVARVTSAIRDFFNDDTLESWKKKLGAFGLVLAPLLGGILLAGVLKGMGGLLSKIPFLGKLFGGGRAGGGGGFGLGIPVMVMNWPTSLGGGLGGGLGSAAGAASAGGSLISKAGLISATKFIGKGFALGAAGWVGWETGKALDEWLMSFKVYRDMVEFQVDLGAKLINKVQSFLGLAYGSAPAQAFLQSQSKRLTSGEGMDRFLRSMVAEAKKEEGLTVAGAARKRIARLVASSTELDREGIDDVAKAALATELAEAVQKAFQKQGVKLTIIDKSKGGIKVSEIANIGTINSRNAPVEAPRGTE